MILCPYKSLFPESNLEGDPFPIQLLVTPRLSPEENRWLNSLRPGLQPDVNLDALLKEYEQHKDSKLYQAAMDLIVRANPVTIEEARSMCEALHELFADDVKKAVEEVTEEITEKVTEKVTEEVTKKITRKDILLFIEILLEDGYSVVTICEKLYKKFSLTDKETLGYIQEVSGAVQYK